MGSIRPGTLAHNYRLNISSLRKPKTIVGRTKSEEVPIIEVTAPESPAPLKKRTMTDEDFEELEDSFYFDLSSPNEVWINGQDTVIELYETICKKLGTIASSSVKSNLLKETFCQRFVTLHQKDCKAICCALVDDRYVHKIEFEQNGLCKNSIDHLAQVVGYSSFLTHVTISDNNLRSYGAKVICEAVTKGKRIEYLDVSANEFVESDGTIFKDLLNNTKSLRELILARNNLMNHGVQEIASAVEQSVTLKTLDLQWNHIRLQGAVAIGEAIGQNKSLETVNLAWNGLHKDGAQAIADALRENVTLKELDLSCNRLTEECLADILTGLDHNETLEVLRVAQNHITCIGAESILRHISGNQSSGIKLLDFGNQEVKDTFVAVYKDLQEKRGVHVIHGVVWDTRRKSLTTAGGDDDEVALLRCNPLTVLMECMRLQNFRLIDLFKSLDSNKSNFICIDELCDGLLKFGVPVRKAMLMKLLHRLDKDNNKDLDYGEMIEAQNMHRKNLRKALQVAESDFDKTDIGKVSALLRRIMAKSFVMKSKQNDTRLKTPKRDLSRTPSPFELDQIETGIAQEGFNPKARVKSAGHRKNSTANTDKTVARVNKGAGKK